MGVAYPNIFVVKSRSLFLYSIVKLQLNYQQILYYNTIFQYSYAPMRSFSADIFHIHLL